MRASWWWLAVMVACTAETTDTADDETDVDTDVADETDETDETADESLVLEDVITVTTPTPGSQTCLGEDLTLSTAEAHPTCIHTVDLTGDLEDFESGDGVGGVTVEFFWDDIVDGSPDATAVSELGGAVTGVQAPTCTAWASRALAVEGESKTTIQLHWSEPDTDPLDTFFNSVSEGSFALISALVSIEPDITMGALAGTVYDCGGEGIPMAGVQVILRQGDAYPGSQEIRYFTNEFPSVLQPETSEDGLWLIANVPVGNAVIEAYAVLGEGEEPSLIAKTEVVVQADSFVIADVYTGSGDGKVLPASCLTSCAPQ